MVIYCLVVILNAITHCETVLIWELLANADVAVICIWVVNWRLDFVQELLFLKLVRAAHVFDHYLFNTYAPWMFKIIVLIFNWQIRAVPFTGIADLIHGSILNIQRNLFFLRWIRTLVRLHWVSNRVVDRVCIWCLNINVNVSLMIIFLIIIFIFVFGIYSNISLILNIIEIKL